jgi:hypothetical protein
MQTVSLDTLGKLHAYRYGLWGWCRECAKLYRMDVPAEQRVRAAFEIDLAALIAERGAESTCIRMAPVLCPRCGSRDTEQRISPPPHRAS